MRKLLLGHQQSIFNCGTSWIVLKCQIYCYQNSGKIRSVLCATFVLVSISESKDKSYPNRKSRAENLTLIFGITHCFVDLKMIFK